MLRDRLIGLAKRLLPPEARSWIVAQQRRYRLQYPRVNNVNIGHFRRLTPISPVFGLDRGLSIGRYYIERFLEDHAGDVRGRVLEFGDDHYTRRFGGDRVTRSDVLHVVEGNPEATIVADLARADAIPSASFDCIIQTQTIQMIYEIREAMHHTYRILKPGGVLLLTSHGISKIGRYESRDDWGEYWHLTTDSARRLLEETFLDSAFQVYSYGNVLTAICALHGLAAEELEARELEYRDRDFPVLVAARAVKGAAEPSR